MMAEIIIDHVTKKIQKSTVIDDISMEIHPREITGFKGVNGSGKTMLMRLIAGLIYPTAGEVRIDGKRLGKDITFPQSIGILIENPAFLNAYSGRENLKMLASIRDLVGLARVDEVLKLVGLWENAEKKYKKYSLGMKQRLGIAAAILENPDILILDEPTNALDDSGVALVKEIIFAEKARGATVIVSCHDFSLLRAVADTVYCLDNGKLTAQYTAETLRAKMQQDEAI